MKAYRPSKKHRLKVAKRVHLDRRSLEELLLQSKHAKESQEKERREALRIE